MNYAVKLPVFEGPLDLLLHLVEANRVDIYDIPVAQITAQYVDYLAAISDLDLEAAAQFLLMAATLLEIKARLLLPKPPAPPAVPEPDPRQELVERLLVYRRFKRAAAHLSVLAAEQARRYLRGGQVFLGEPPRGELDPVRLAAALRSLLKRPGAVGEVGRRRFSVRQKMREILWRLRRHPEGLRFRSLLAAGATRAEVIVTFLALLELLRWRRLTVLQESPCGEILILPREGRVLLGESPARPA